MFSAKVARNIQCADAVDVEEFDTTTNLMGVKIAPNMPKFIQILMVNDRFRPLNILSTKAFLETRPDLS